MEDLETLKNPQKATRTRADEIKSERVQKALFDEIDAYPNGTAFIASDGSPAFATTLEQCFRQRSPIAIIFPDGSEVLALPPRTRVIGALRRILSRLERDGNGVAPAGLLSVPFPADYVVEVREVAASA